MANAVVFKTPGEIDLTSFTTFGLNYKPNTDNPIGRFGTGLKYAIAVLLRNGASVVVWIGRIKYTFFISKKDFRGKEFELVGMKRESFSLSQTLQGKPQYTKLPFTIDYGRDWKMWQAFREIQSNTIDEVGETFLVSNPAEYGNLHAAANTTLIIVENSEFVDCFHEKDKIFLPEAMTQRDVSEACEILEQSSQYIYFRGLRVADTQKPTMHTYNVLRTIDLTEDRTVKYDFQVQESVARTVATSTDKEFIEKILTAPKEYWESDLKFEGVGVKPSEEFKEVTRSRRSALSPSARRYGDSHSSHYATLSTWDRFPVPWNTSYRGIEDSNGVLLFEKPYDFNTTHFTQLARDVVDIVNKEREGDIPPPDDLPEVEAPDETAPVFESPPADLREDIPF